MQESADSHTDSRMEEESHHNSSSSGSLNKKKRLLKKAPEAPKRFRSAYICYVAEQLEKEKSSPIGNVMKVTEVMKVLAKKWKALPDNEKQKHEQLAAADKRRYFEELDKYSGPLQIPNKRVKKNPNAPKRAMSAFLSYSQYMRSTARQMFPELKNTELSSALAKMWREASEVEKRPHLEREQRDRSKYHKDMEAWKDLDNLNRSEGQSQSNPQSKSFEHSVISGFSDPADYGTGLSQLQHPSRTFGANENAESESSNFLDDPNNECNSLWGGTDDADLYTSDLPFDPDRWNNNREKGSKDGLQLQENESQSDPNSESPGKTHNHNTGSTSSSSAFGSSNRGDGSDNDSGGTTSHESNSSLQGSAGYYPYMSSHSYGATSSSNGYVDGYDIPAPNQSKWNRVRDSSRPQSQAHDLSSSSPVMKVLQKEPLRILSHSVNVDKSMVKGVVNGINTAATNMSNTIASIATSSVASGPSITSTTQASVQTKKNGQSSYQSEPCAPGFGPFRGIAKSVHKQQQLALESSIQKQQPTVQLQSMYNSNNHPTHLSNKTYQQSERSSGRSSSSSSSITNSCDLRSSSSFASDSNKKNLLQPQRQTIFYSPSPSVVASSCNSYQFEPNSSVTFLYNDSNRSQSSIPYQSSQDRRDGNRHFHENMMYGNRESYKPHPVIVGSNDDTNDNRKSRNISSSSEVISDYNEKGKNKLNATHLKQLNQWNAANHQSILNPNSFSESVDRSARMTTHCEPVHTIRQDATTSRPPPKTSAIQDTRSEDSARSGPSSASDVWPFNVDLDSSERQSDKTSDKLSESPENVGGETDYDPGAGSVQDGSINKFGYNYDSNHMQFNPIRPCGIQHDQSELEMCCHSQSAVAYPPWFNSFMPMDMPRSNNNNSINNNQKSLQHPSDSILLPIYPINYMPTFISTPYLNHDYNQTNSTEFQSFYNSNSATGVNMKLYNNQCSELMSAMQNHPSYSFNKQNRIYISSPMTNPKQQFDNFNAQTDFISAANSVTNDVMTTSDYVVNLQNRMDKHEPKGTRPPVVPSRDHPSYAQSINQQSRKSQKQKREQNVNESILRTLRAVDEAGLFDNSE